VARAIATETVVMQADHVVIPVRVRWLEPNRELDDDALSLAPNPLLTFAPVLASQRSARKGPPTPPSGTEVVPAFPEGSAACVRAGHARAQNKQGGAQAEPPQRCEGVRSGLPAPVRRAQVAGLKRGAVAQQVMGRKS
jgi:hypothetical protein